MFWLMLTCRVALEPAKASRTRRASARGRQHLLRPCRATAAEELEQMPLKALLFDCDGESHVDTWMGLANHSSASMSCKPCLRCPQHLWVYCRCHLVVGGVAQGGIQCSF